MTLEEFIKQRDVKVRDTEHLKVIKYFYPYLRSVSGDAGLLPSALEKMLGIDLTDISVVTACFNGVNDGSKAPYDNVDLYIKLNNDIKVFVYGRNQEDIVELKENLRMLSGNQKDSLYDLLCSSKKSPMLDLLTAQQFTNE